MQQQMNVDGNKHLFIASLLKKGMKETQQSSVSEISFSWHKESELPNK
jgi:hypothetical protein